MDSIYAHFPSRDHGRQLLIDHDILSAGHSSFASTWALLISHLNQH